MFSRNRRKAKVLFALADVVGATLAFLAAYQTRVVLDLENQFYLTTAHFALLLGFAVGTFVLLGYALDLYDRLETAAGREVLAMSLQQSALAAAAVVLLEFVLRLDLSRLFLGLFTTYAFLLLVVFRGNAMRMVGLIRREFGAPHYVFVVGTGERAMRLGRTLEESSAFGVRLSGFLDEAPAGGRVRLGQEYPVFPLGDLTQLLRRQIIDEILFAVESSRLPGLEEVFLLCDEEGVRTRVAMDFFPHVNSHVYLDRLGNAPLLTFSAAPHDDLRLMVKRVADVLIAAVSLVVLTPVMLLIAVLIRLTSPGPVIFRQVRCGLNGRRFVFYKFRSMCANAEELKAQVAHLNEKELAFKIPHDPRLTSIGHWLRKFSIDEWPQLWNVLKGDMSLVGPRPAVPEEVEQYQRWQRRRLRMRPGLTCLWALAGRDQLDFESWMRMDMQYIDTWSLALDWKIILRTIPEVLSGRGAH